MINLTSDSFKKLVLEADGPVLVDFNADWCGPCQMQAPILEEAEQIIGDKCTFASLNIDAEEELAKVYDIFSIPCLVLFKDGREVDRKEGMQSLKKIVKWVS